ncbi:hypothetical protein EDB89DRAFT_2242504, partial [Lactarius sanguifluus]
MGSASGRSICRRRKRRAMLSERARNATMPVRRTQRNGRNKSWARTKGATAWVRGGDDRIFRKRTGVRTGGVGIHATTEAEGRGVRGEVVAFLKQTPAVALQSGEDPNTLRLRLPVCSEIHQIFIYGDAETPGPEPTHFSEEEKALLKKKRVKHRMRRKSFAKTRKDTWPFFLGGLQGGGKQVSTNKLHPPAVTDWRWCSVLLVISLDVSPNCDLKCGLSTTGIFHLLKLFRTLATLPQADGKILEYHRLLTFSPRSDPRRPTLLRELAALRNNRFALSDQKGDLDKSITHLTEAILLPFQPSQDM